MTDKLVTLTIGEKKYNDTSVKFQAYIVNSSDGSENHILKYVKDPNFDSNIEVKTTNYQSAIPEKTHRLGGYYSTMDLTYKGEEPLLLRLTFSYNIRTRRRYGSMMVMLREGSSLGSLELNKIPTGNHDNDLMSLIILSGAYDIVDNDQIKSFGIEEKLQSRTIEDNYASKYGYFIENTIVSPISRPFPIMVESSIVLGNGEEVVVRKRSKRPSRFINMK